MKKAIIYGMSLALILSMTACGGSNENAADKSQDTSTPAVTQPVESSTPEITATPEQTTPETTPTPESVSTPAQENTAAPQETDSLFTDCSETMYATTTVNVRSSYSTNSDKLGSLTKAQSVTRTGIGTGDAAGWSRIEFNGKVAYVSSDYLSATKPQVSVSKPSTDNSSSGSTQTSKPSTKPSTGGSGGGNSQTTTSGSEIDKGSSNTSSGSGGGLSGLAGAIEQGREDHGYSGGVGGPLTDEDREWVGGQIQVGQPPASGGLGGLINREPPSNSNPDAFKDNQSEGNAGINVN